MDQNFKNDVMNWLQKYGCNEVRDIISGSEYAYWIEDHTIMVGSEVFDCTADWFVEYLENRGCECYGISDDVLSFLHEVGHSMTIHSIADDDLAFYGNLKHMFWNEDKLKDSVMVYWNIPDERAANEWEIQFINENPDAVIELMEIFERSSM